jgi:potassium/hydrogen antiporter
VLLLYGATTLLHGSGFLAVFVGGIVIGQRRAPYQREIERFHAALAGLAEIVAFVGLGLTIDLTVLARTDVWLPGLILGLALAIIIRPLVVGLCLLPAQLERGERAFVMFAGLKGAVPILLGLLLLTADVPDTEPLYGIVVIVVIFSVVVQGSLVPTVARRLRVPMQPIRPKPGHSPSGFKLSRTRHIRSRSPPDLSSTGEQSRSSPTSLATCGSAWWYAMGCCCRRAETRNCELVTW